MLTGFVLGVIVSFFGSAIFSIILAALMEVGSFESVGIAEAGQPLATMLREKNRPKHDSEQITKNYTIHDHQQTPKLQAHGRQLAPSPQNSVISQHAKDLVRKLLMAKIRLAGLNGITSISDRWLEGYINTKYELLAK